MTEAEKKDQDAKSSDSEQDKVQENNPGVNKGKMKKPKARAKKK